MTQAAFELQRTDVKVIDIALKYGYTSPTSFNRAFQSVHNITPAAARNKGCTLNAYPAIRFLVQVTGGNAMTYHIAEKSSMRMAGVRIPLSADMEENQKKIPEFKRGEIRKQAKTLISSRFKDSGQTGYK